MPIKVNYDYGIKIWCGNFNCMALINSAMDIEKFREGDIPGELVSYEGHYAFNPDPLPPDIEMDMQLANAHSDALQAVSELKGIGRNVDNPQMLIRPFIRREAVLSSRIEGTRAELSDVYAVEVGQENSVKRARRDDAREVMNYVYATERGLSELEDSEIDLELIKLLHEILLSDVRGEGKKPGELRDRANFIGGPDANIADARFVPPPQRHAEFAIQQLSDYMQSDREFPPLIELGFIHYQFETIHPFLDGNGRMGRLLITLLLCKWGLLDDPFLYISAYFNRNRSEYIDHLYKVSAENGWKEWLIFFLDAVRRQANEAYIRSKELLNLKSEYRDRYKNRRSSTHLQLAEYLFSQPVLTVNDAKEKLECAYPTANDTVSQLVEDDILREVTGKERNRRFQAYEVMDILRKPLDDIELRSDEGKQHRQANLGEYA